MLIETAWAFVVEYTSGSLDEWSRALHWLGRVAERVVGSFPSSLDSEGFIP